MSAAEEASLKTDQSSNRSTRLGAAKAIAGMLGLENKNPEARFSKQTMSDVKRGIERPLVWVIYPKTRERSLEIAPRKFFRVDHRVG